MHQSLTNELIPMTYMANIYINSYFMFQIDEKQLQMCGRYNPKYFKRG